jgi:hypothetical protein
MYRLDHPDDPGLGQLDPSRTLGQTTVTIEDAFLARWRFRAAELRQRLEAMRERNPNLPQIGEQIEGE